MTNDDCRMSNEGIQEMMIVELNNATRREPLGRTTGPNDHYKSK
jgi:hypothetical protein